MERGTQEVISGISFTAFVIITSRIKILLLFVPSFTVAGTFKIPTKSGSGIITLFIKE